MSKPIRKKEGDGAFELTPGAGDFPGWGGVNTEVPHCAPPSNMLQLGINVLPEKGGMKVRPSIHKFNPSDFFDYFNTYGIMDCQQGKGTKLWAVIGGCPGASGGSIMTYDYDQEPEFQVVAKFLGTANLGLQLGVYGSDVYVGENQNLRKLQLRTDRFGVPQQSAGDLGHRVVHRFTTASGAIRAVKQFDGYLFVSEGTLAAGTTYTWDGTTMVSDDTSIASAVKMAYWRENLVAGFQDAGANYIRVRTPGTSGAWSSVAPAAGSLLTQTGGQTMISYHDVLYILDTSTGVWSYDGTTLQSAHTVAGATMRAIEVFNDVLYFAYDTGTEAIIGSYDYSTTTWTDEVKNLTDQYTYNYRVHGLMAHRGSLFAGIGGDLYQDTYSGTNQQYYTARLVVSPGPTVSGTWLGDGAASYDAGDDATGPVLIMVN